MPLPEAQTEPDFTQRGLKIHRKDHDTHQDLSSHLRAGRRDRRERGEGKSQRRPGEGGPEGPGVQGWGAWLRVAMVPSGPRGLGTTMGAGKRENTFP